MYEKFFGLKREPFSIAPDPHYLFMSERHREALAHLLYGVRSGGGFVLLTGAIGAGKTTVCRCFLEQVPKNCNVAYIFNPKQTAEELLESICDDFRVTRQPVPGRMASARDHVAALNLFLLRTHGVGQNNVLIIDEAQSLSAEVLEQLRLLTNLETNERKLLQIILIGQPELRDMLARPELEQLAQRVIARYHLGALTARETSRYIRHRLAVAGLSTALPFDGQAIQRIHVLSRGVPRRINLLCDRALLGAYASGKALAGVDIVDKAAAEVLAQVPRRSPWSLPLSARARLGVMVGVGALLGAALLGAAMLAWDVVRSPATGTGTGSSQHQAGR
ncbi:MAG: ExeA family protein [Rubrivivax sp.]